MASTLGRGASRGCNRGAPPWDLSGASSLESNVLSNSLFELPFAKCSEDSIDKENREGREDVLDFKANIRGATYRE